MQEKLCVYILDLLDWQRSCTHFALSANCGRCSSATITNRLIYRNHVTDSIVIFQVRNHLKFTKRFVWILEIPGGGGVFDDPSGMEIPGGWGGGVQNKKPSVGGVWIFSGTTQSIIINALEPTFPKMDVYKVVAWHWSLLKYYQWI